MKDNSFCPAVKDLLPLYGDGALSQETEELISRHLRACGECRALYEKIKGEDINTANESEERMRYQKVAKRIRRRRAGVVGLVVLLCVLIFIITASMFQPAIVSGDCMAPTVRDGEYYIINKWAYKTDVPSRRDILVYEKDGIYHITRVIGLPGECVEMRQGDVYIDGRRYGEYKDYPKDCRLAQTELGSDEYFVLEDNLKASENNEHMIRERDITGKVMVTH